MPRTKQEAMERPEAGQVFRLRNKTRTITSVGTCVEGKLRICYEQITVKGISTQAHRFTKWAAAAEYLGNKGGR